MSVRTRSIFCFLRSSRASSPFEASLLILNFPLHSSNRAYASAFVEKLLCHQRLICCTFLPTLHISETAAVTLNKKPSIIDFRQFMAEKVGFEPTCPGRQPHFECGSLWPLRYFSKQYSSYNILIHFIQDVNSFSWKSMCPFKDNFQEYIV